MVDYSNIQINLVSNDTFERMSTAERLQFIINEVKQGKVLILEQGLTPTEQFELNKLTMSEIDHESFIGVEMPGFSTEVKKPGILDRLFRRRRTPRMMAVGPAKLMRIIKKEPSLIQTVIMPMYGAGPGRAEGEGIPLDEEDSTKSPEALPLDDGDLSEHQARLDEFSKNSKEATAETDSSEELKMLIGPELQKETQADADAGSEEDLDTKEGSDKDRTLEPSSKAQGIGEPLPMEEQDEGQKGYILRKIREEGEDE